MVRFLSFVTALSIFLLVALVVALPANYTAASNDSANSNSADASTTAQGAGVKSVCEAQRLKRDLAARGIDPKTANIPAEYDRQWPSVYACDSHDAALDAATPGPLQPIPFSHKHHSGAKEVGGFAIDCQYCHSNTDRAQAAGVPSVENCMGCHKSFPAEYDELSGIRTLRSKWQTYTDASGATVEDPVANWTPGGRWTDRPVNERQSIEWIQVHRLPEHVQFRHNRHVKAGKTCQDCHGQVQEMDKLYLVPDRRFVNGMPAAKLEMGWCVDCHRTNKAVIDCATCHY